MSAEIKSKIKSKIPQKVVNTVKVCYIKVDDIILKKSVGNQLSLSKSDQYKKTFK